LQQRRRPHHRALVAAHSVAIAGAFNGRIDAAMPWLIDHIPATAPEPIDRHVFDEAVRLCDPSDEWASLRAAPGGAAILQTWLPRHDAIAAYRAHLSPPYAEGIRADDVLGSLLHAHYIRAVAIDFDDEAACLYLTRAAAKAYLARHGEPQ